MTVLTASGKSIDWHNPPAATSMALWSNKTSGGKPVRGSFRSICFLEYLNALAIKKFGRGIVVIQSAYNTGVRASAGTHDYDACYDIYIPGVAWSTAQAFCRVNGAGAYWRKPPAFGNHLHLFVLPPREGHVLADDYRVFGFRVGKYVDGGWSLYGRKTTSAQIEDYYAHRTALAGHARDYSWFPDNIEATIFNLPAFIAVKRGPVVVTPPPPAPTPAVKGSIKVRVATNNIMSLPKNPDVDHTLESYGGASVMFVQEADLPEFHTALRHVKGMTTASVPGGNVYNAFVMYNPKVWEHVSTHFAKQYDGHGGISYTRHVAVTVLRHRDSRIKAGFVSYHSVTAGNDFWRNKMRKEGDAVAYAEVNKLRKEGMPVFLGTDANRKGRVFWTTTSWYAHGIDHLYVWTRAKKFTLKGLARWVVSTRSDHDTFISEYLLTPKK